MSVFDLTTLGIMAKSNGTTIAKRPLNLLVVLLLKFLVDKKKLVYKYKENKLVIPYVVQSSFRIIQTIISPV